MRFLLGFAALAGSVLCASRIGALLGSGPWETLVAGAPIVGGAAYFLGQIQQLWHDPYREPLPLEEPGVWNPGPAVWAFLGFGTVALLIVSVHRSIPGAFELRRALGALGGSMLVAQGVSQKAWVVEMNEMGRMARWFGTTAQRRTSIAFGVVVVLFFLLAPGEWVTSMLEAFERSRARRSDRLGRIFSSDTG